MHVSSTLLLHPIFFLPAVVLYVYNAWRPVLAGYQIEFEISSLPSPVVARRSRVEHWLDILAHVIIYVVVDDPLFFSC